MTTLFCIRPATPNIGNDLINISTSNLLYETFGDDLSIVNVPALWNGARGGLTKQQVYDMNRFADGVIVGGGNLFENGQVSLDRHALDALRAPLMLIGLSHGRIREPSGEWAPRSDSMPADAIQQLVAKATVAMVRDTASQAILDEIGGGAVELGGCPSLFLPANPPNQITDGRVLLSIRHPARMSVPPTLQWRTAEDVRRLIAMLREAHGDVVHLVCHDYMDLEFAAGFPDTPQLYFDDVHLYIAALRRCRLNVSYRLHAFLPCLAFGVPSIHLSYDERGKAMVATAGMASWDIDLVNETDLEGAVTARMETLDEYRRLKQAGATAIDTLRDVTLSGLKRFASAVERRRSDARRH